MSRASKSTSLKLSHGERRVHIVRAIVEKIVMAELKPGDRLITQDLANEFGVSLTPIREALAELAGVGIVDLHPNRGAIVHQFSAREIFEVCRVRRALECEAVRGAISRIPDELIRKISEELELLRGQVDFGKRSVRKAQELDSRLHETIAAHSGNRFLSRELQRLGLLFRSLRDSSWSEVSQRDAQKRLKEEADEHLDISQAIEQRNVRRAVRAMSRHIAMSAKYWSAFNQDRKKRSS